MLDFRSGLWPDAFKAQRLEPVAEGGLSGFRCQAASPVLLCQPPADLGADFGGHKAAKADQQAVVFEAQGPLAVAMLVQVADRSVDESPGLLARPWLPVANKLHHARI